MRCTRPGHPRGRRQPPSRFLGALIVLLGSFACPGRRPRRCAAVGAPPGPAHHLTVVHNPADNRRGEKNVLIGRSRPEDASAGRRRHCGCRGRSGRTTTRCSRARWNRSAGARYRRLGAAVSTPLTWSSRATAAR